jgi:hypothetical protein
VVALRHGTGSRRTWWRTTRPRRRSALSCWMPFWRFLWRWGDCSLRIACWRGIMYVYSVILSTLPFLVLGMRMGDGNGVID